jgi:hypothetical protein
MSGNYSLPSSNPVVPATIIATAWANPTMSDVADALTASLDRYGRGGMLAPFYCEDGSAGAPGLSFTGEPNSGLYRAAPDDLRMSVGGADVSRWSGGAFTLWRNAGWRSPAVIGLDNAFTAIQTFTLGITLPNNMAVNILDTGGVSQEVLTVKNTGGCYIGGVTLHAYLQSYNNPDWFDGSTVRPLATQAWASGAFGALSGANVWTGIQTFTATYTSFYGAIYLNNASHYYVLDTGGNPKNIGYVGNNDILYLGDVTSPQYLMAPTTPKWWNGATEETLATQPWVTGISHTWGAYQIFDNSIISRTAGIDGNPGNPANAFLFQNATLGATYQHKILATVSSVSDKSWLDFYICSGADTWSNVMRLRGDGAAIFSDTISAVGHIYAAGIFSNGGFFSAATSVLVFQAGATYVGNPGFGVYVQASSVPSWYDGTNIRAFATQEWVNTRTNQVRAFAKVSNIGGILFGNGISVVRNTTGDYTVTAAAGTSCYYFPMVCMTSDAAAFTIGLVQNSMTDRSFKVQTRDATNHVVTDVGFMVEVLYIPF